MGGGIYLIQDGGQLVEMSEAGYESEDLLQGLLAQRILELALPLRGRRSQRGHQGHPRIRGRHRRYEPAPVRDEIWRAQGSARSSSGTKVFSRSARSKKDLPSANL